MYSRGEPQHKIKKRAVCLTVCVQLVCPMSDSVCVCVCVGVCVCVCVWVGVGGGAFSS